ncbi:MAG: chorismate mutase / prephenate dehydratase [Candidatus Binatota bacterium]|nr:chorismate mutase / prephenate dehydratase [Candidatus Binatota bacterium]
MSRRSASPEAASRGSIERLRGEIDAVDDRLLGLLEERAELAREIGRAKARDGAVVYVPSREKKILERLTRKRHSLPENVVRAVFREVISACRSLERPVRVAYLGPEATFSHLAAREQFGANAVLLPVGSIRQIFDEVERGRAEFGVAPIENSTDGSVAHTLDRLLESDLKIAAEICLEVNHCLLSKTGRPEDVRRVLSHPQALAQCRRWLATHHPQATLDETASTARAAEVAAANADAAAIASGMAAEAYDLAILAENIQDYSFNATRFVVVAAEDSPRPSGDDKTSAVFSVRDEVGILHRMLRPFSEHDINLTRIESRPLKGKPWEYVFFLDFLGHRKERRVGRALASLDRICQMLKVLGSYPTWR